MLAGWQMTTPTVRFIYLLWYFRLRLYPTYMSTRTQLIVHPCNPSLWPGAARYHSRRYHTRRHTCPLRRCSHAPQVGASAAHSARTHAPHALHGTCWLHPSLLCPSVLARATTSAPGGTNCATIVRRVSGRRPHIILPEQCNLHARLVQRPRRRARPPRRRASAATARHPAQRR